MKPVAAFTVGLWTGTLVMTAVGLLYFHRWAGTASKPTPPAQDQREIELATLKQDHARLTAEAQRLRETVAEMRNRLAAEVVRRIPFRRPAEALAAEAWIVDSVANPDAQALAKLEEAALKNNLDALDAVALLADRDKAETLTRLWQSPTLNDAGKQRAAFLMAATVELNPRGEELLLALAGNVPELPVAVLGLESPGFFTRLTRGTGITPAPRFKPDYALRLRIVTELRAAVTNEALAARLDQVRDRLEQRISAVAQP